MGNKLPILFMKGCRLSTTLFCLFISSLSSNNRLLARYLLVVAAQWVRRQAGQTTSAARGESRGYPSPLFSP